MEIFGKLIILGCGVFVAGLITFNFVSWTWPILLLLAGPILIFSGLFLALRTKKVSDWKDN